MLEGRVEVQADKETMAVEKYWQSFGLVAPDVRQGDVLGLRVERLVPEGAGGYVISAVTTSKIEDSNLAFLCLKWEIAKRWNLADIAGFVLGRAI